MGGPGYRIKGEFKHNGFSKNNLKHTRGVLSMARSMMPDTAGSQFFIMHDKAPHLDGEYAAFGMVIEGMDEVDKIASAPTDYNDRPAHGAAHKKSHCRDLRRRLPRAEEVLIRQTISPRLQNQSHWLWF